ncbi:hypothetical protein N0V95_003422 [Ascochyta clinopodiicola]|nr:hypothetical protein N0V95_003422 [Ascochyta clinopodiicola]
MSTNSIATSVFTTLGELFEVLFNVMLILLILGAGVVVLGTIAGCIYNAFDYLKNRDRYTVGRIIKYARKLYPDYTAIEVKIKRNHDDVDDDLGLSQCSAAVCGTKDGQQSQLMVVETWCQSELLSDLEKKIIEALREKQAAGELETEYEWRVAESAFPPMA